MKLCKQLVNSKCLPINARNARYSEDGVEDRSGSTDKVISIR